MASRRRHPDVVHPEEVAPGGTWVMKLIKEDRPPVDYYDDAPHAAKQ